MTDIQIKLLRICGSKGKPIKKVCNKLNIGFDSLNHILSDPEMEFHFFIEESDKPFAERVINATFDGLTVVRKRRRETFGLFYPNILSTIATIISIIALVISLSR